eukprot:TRINITY_DN11227_c0_g2_i3.p1 TRINITY_DN11227_c0_g2~~TRINITY_DN11227_c0_g2_i3.p1  ORF type:complete len:153 (-),score=12.37 TRINITY_DN11227_c0_g2_i3:228-686(-)
MQNLSTFKNHYKKCHHSSTFYFHQNHIITSIITKILVKIQFQKLHNHFIKQRFKFIHKMVKSRRNCFQIFDSEHISLLQTHQEFRILVLSQSLSDKAHKSICDLVIIDDITSKNNIIVITTFVSCNIKSFHLDVGSLGEEAFVEVNVGLKFL